MKYYQAEMHCHTAEVSPCSRVPAEAMVQGYLDAGYRYAFITDHYHPAVLESAGMQGKSWEQRIDHLLSGYGKARRLSEGTKLHVLLGTEVVLNRDEKTGIGNDFLVYGFDRDFLLEHPYLNRMSCPEFCALMRENGFLTFHAHPYRDGHSPAQPVCYDGVEIVNTHPRHVSHNRKAVAFALEHRLYTISGSDAHAPEDIGRGGVLLPGGIETPMDFVQYVREHGSPELIVTFGA
jgi:predicted metal-dependent phosphoesterase TrpH